MGMQLRNRRARYMLGAGVATVLAISTAGLAASAAASPGWKHCSTSITKQRFGTANSGPYGGNQTVFRFTMTNRNCMQVRVMTYGATVQSITVPDRHGNLTDVALGFKTLADYVNLDSPPPTSPNAGGPYFGETIGRYANRIGGASFKLNGQTYTLPVNNGPNTLHGGFVGWGNRVWQNPTTASGKGSVLVTMTLVAPNGDEGSGLLPGTQNFEPNCSPPGSTPTTCTGFPAQVTTSITYTLDNSNRLWLRYRAHNDDPNLATDANLIPTGQIVPVAGTPFDFRSFHAIGERIGDASAPQGNQLVLAHGYDH